MRRDSKQRPVTTLGARWLILSVIIGVLVGCFQPAGNGLEPTSVELVDLTKVATMLTTTPTPFVTPLPTQQETPTETPVIIESIITPTEIPSATPVATTELPPQQPPSNTPEPSPTPLEPSATPNQIQLTDTPTEPQPTHTPSEPLISPTPTLQIVAPEISPTPTTVFLPTPTGLPTDNPCIHTVQQGEWLYSIARKYNINPVDLIAVNPAYANRTLQPGDRLTIPNCTGSLQPQQPQAQQQPTQTPPQQPPVIGPEPTTASAGTPPTPIEVIDRIYIVAQGDTLGAIARKFNTTVQAIKTANGLTSDFLRIGQQLRIPKPE